MSVATLVELRWTQPQADAAIVAYRISTGTTLAAAQELDRTAALRWIAPVDWTGSRTFYVQAVDELGQLGEAASVTVGEGQTQVTTQTPATTVTVDELGNAQITFRPMVEPQIAYYELREGVSFEAGVALDTTAGQVFTVPLLGTVGRTYWIKARYTDGAYSVLTYTVSFTSDALAPVAGLAWTVAGAELRFTWRPVPGAAQYVALFEDQGVARIKVTASPEVAFYVPKGSSAIRIIAVANNGNLSAPLDEEVYIVGQYRLNEVLTLALPISTGRYVNMAWTNSNTVRRAGLRGLAPAAPFAANINDGDLFGFGYNLEAVPASQFVDTPASWFRTNFWRERNGAFESGTLDLGGVKSGRIVISLTKQVDYVGDAAVQAYSYVAAEYLSESTATELVDTRAFVTVQLLVSADNTTWRAAENGDWVSARYIRLAAQVAMASPLTEVRITAGTLTFDVEDIIETGSKTGVTNAGAAVTFTKPFTSVSVVIATARGAATAYATAVGPTGCTLWTNSATPTQVDYFVKGY